MEGSHAPLMQSQRQRANAGHAGNADTEIEIFGPVVGCVTENPLFAAHQHCRAKREGETAHSIKYHHAAKRHRRLGAGKPVLPGSADQKQGRGNIHQNDAKPIDTTEDQRHARDRRREAEQPCKTPGLFTGAELNGGRVDDAETGHQEDISKGCNDRPGIDRIGTIEKDAGNREAERNNQCEKKGIRPARIPCPEKSHHETRGGNAER